MVTDRLEPVGSSPNRSQVIPTAKTQSDLGNGVVVNSIGRGARQGESRSS